VLHVSILKFISMFFSSYFDDFLAAALRGDLRS
jgi:hypothetical protein